MSISPQNFEVSETLLRQRLEISPDAYVFPFGYEGLVDNALIRLLKKRYTTTSLYFRTRPDFMVFDGEKHYLVEAKQKTKNIEALQLFFNKQLERMGIKVVYSFPEVAICASAIPIDEIIVPENYKEKFDSNLKYLFESEGITNFRYVPHVIDGSGDAFVPVELEDLRILSEEVGI